MYEPTLISLRMSRSIGPSGSGKTTVLKSLNRINDELEGFRMSGRISFNR